MSVGGGVLAIVDSHDATAEPALPLEEFVHDVPSEPAPPPPTTRGDCLTGGSNEARPCPWRGCRWHLSSIQTRRAETDESCVLDIADEGGMRLDEIGDVLGLTRERIRQIEAEALAKVGRRLKLARARC